MTSPAVPGGSTGGRFRPAVRPERCSLAARARGDGMAATAPPARRFVLLEVPGPWLPDLLSAAGLRPDVTRHVRDAATAMGARLLLIRRPGRSRPGPGGLRRWAVVDRDAGVRWGWWQHDDDLLALDLGNELTRVQPHTDLPLVLVCTHGRKDVCCAVEGRPVAAALAADPRLDAWECTHLGGDRFAANVLWLPAGLLFGGVTGSSVPAVVAAALESRVIPAHFRGRCGDPLAAQAAQWQLMQTLGEDRPGRIVIESAPIVEHGQLRLIATHDGQRYQLDLIPSWTEPQQLTCQAAGNARMRTFRLAHAPVLL